MEEQSNHAEFIRQISKAAPWITSEGIDYMQYPVQLIARDITSLCDKRFRNACFHAVAMSLAGRKDAMFLLLGAFEYYRGNYHRLIIIAKEIHGFEDDRFIDYLYHQIISVRQTAHAQHYLNCLIGALSRCDKQKAIEKFRLSINDSQFPQRIKNKFGESLNNLIREIR